MENTLVEMLASLMALTKVNKKPFKKKPSSAVIEYYRKRIAKQIIEHVEKGSLDEYLKKAN